jgi:hypothetical protein
MFNRDIIEHVCFQQKNIAKKEKKERFFGAKFYVSCQHAPINLRFKKPQQLTVSNAFPAQDFI